MTQSNVDFRPAASKAWYVLAVSAAGLGSACGAEAGSDAGGDAQGVPLYGQAPLSGEATICGEIELLDVNGVKGKRPEFYVFEAINAKLGRFPVLQQRFGARHVSTCESGRRFMKVYSELRRERPDYFVDPAESPIATSYEPIEGVQITDQNVASFHAAVQLGAGSTHPAVLRIDWPSGGRWCSGTSISAYGILTAAHCVPENGWHQVYVSRMNGASSTAPLLGGLVWVYFNRHASYGGTGDWGDDVAVGTLWYEYPVSSLPSPTTHAIRLGDRVTINTGSRLDIRGYGATDVWGTGAGVQRKGEVQVSMLSTNYIGIVPVTGDATPNVPCKGDSGGPVSRPHGTVEVQYSISSGFDRTGDWESCAIGDNESFSALVSRKLAFVEQQLGFACSRFLTVSPAGQIARCW